MLENITLNLGIRYTKDIYSNGIGYNPKLRDQILNRYIYSNGIVYNLKLRDQIHNRYIYSNVREYNLNLGIRYTIDIYILMV